MTNTRSSALSTLNSQLLSAAAVVALVAMAACSDDDTPADAGVTPDTAVTPSDGPEVKNDKGKPDGPKKPARWETLPKDGPAVWGHTATLLKDGRVLIAGGLFKPDKTLLATNDTFIYLPQAKQLLPAGKMSTPRGDHTATLLLDGRVLVAGGRSAYSTYVDTAEIFDPKKFDPKNPGANTWTEMAPASIKRVSHGAALLPNGKVLLIGGYSSGTLDSLELFDPVANSWSLLATKLNFKRSAAAITLLKSGNVVIAGGYEFASGVGIWHDTVEVYDSKSGILKLVPEKMQFKRAGHRGTLMADGNVLLTGGYCGGTCKVSGDEIYDPTANKIKHISNPGSSLEHHSAALLRDGRVLCTGGGYTQTKAIAYDPKMGGMWTNLVSMKFGRYDHTATTMPDGLVLVVGGQNGSVGSSGPGVKEVELFYP